jgi:tRNA nucleotidyltransferase/poly(A) polymerase
MPEPLNKAALLELLKQPGVLPEIIDLIEQHLGVDLNPDIPLQRRYISMKQFAQLMGVTPATVYRWLNEEKIQAVVLNNYSIRIQVSKALRRITTPYHPNTAYAKRNTDNLRKLNEQNISRRKNK